MEGVGSSVLPLVSREMGRVEGLMGMYPSEVTSEQLIGGEAMGTYESSEWFSVSVVFINIG